MQRSIRSKNSFLDKNFLGFENIIDSTKNDVIPYANTINKNNFIMRNIQQNLFEK